MIPELGRYVTLHKYSKDAPEFQVVEKPIPQPAKGQVLIKIAASPINPSDLSFLRGEYGIKKELPCVPGFEASGKVVASGGGFYANYLKGKNVACTAPSSGDGTWAEYMIASASGCLPLGKDTDPEQGSMSIVNPLTALSLLEIARSKGAKSVVQSAAAGALGQMIHHLAKKQGLEVINIVRRKEQSERLNAQGMSHILVSTENSFDSDLQDLSHRLGATVAFDAVGGEMTGQIAAALPNNSHVIVYGGLSGDACEVRPGALIFQHQTIHGFWLSGYLSGMNPIRILRLSRSVQKLIRNELRSEIRERYGLEGVARAVQDYTTTMSGGKVLIVP